MHKPKVFFMIPNLNGGGAERVFINIVNNLDQDKYEIKIIVGKLVGPYVKYINNNLKIYELGKMGAINSIVPIIKLLWKEKPDLIFSTLGFVVSTNLAAIFSLKKIKTVARFGNTIKPYLDDIKKKGYIYYYLQKKIHLLIIHLSDYLIVQSDYMKRDIVQLYNLNPNLEAKIIKINNPVDVSHINQMANDDVNFRGREDLKTIRFVSVGRLEYQKGYDYLIKAFFTVRSHIQNTTLIIVGKGSEREKLQKLINELELNNCVYLIGFSDNPYIYIKNADIYVSSSRYEGFSNTVLESLIIGVPVVATDCPSGIQELIKEGSNGWLVNINDDIESNLAKIMMVAAKEYKFLDMKKEKQPVELNYCIEEISKKYENLIDSINN